MKSPCIDIFLIFIFIFNCFSLSFFSADVALSHYAKAFVFVIVLQLSFKVAFSRCVHVWMRAHTHKYPLTNAFVIVCVFVWSAVASLCKFINQIFSYLHPTNNLWIHLTNCFIVLPFIHCTVNDYCFCFCYYYAAGWLTL